MNYKPYGHLNISEGGINYPIKGKLVTLMMNAYPTVAGISCEDNTETVYVVPTGKKFIPVLMLVRMNTGSVLIQIEQSDAQDTGTNPVIKFSFYSVIADNRYVYHSTQLESISAGKYVNVTTSSTTGAPLIVLIYGDEVSA